MVAQDIMKVAPYTVGTYYSKLHPNDTNDTMLYNFNSNDLTWVTVNAIKEQQTEIQQLHNHVNALEIENSNLTALINRICSNNTALCQ